MFLDWTSRTRTATIQKFAFVRDITTCHRGSVGTLVSLRKSTLILAACASLHTFANEKRKSFVAHVCSEEFSQLFQMKKVEISVYRKKRCLRFVFEILEGHKRSSA